MKVLALDVALNTGYAVLEDSDLIAYGVVTTKHTELADRVRDLAKQVKSLEAKYKPDHIIIEQAFFGVNPKVTSLLNQLQGGIAGITKLPVTYLGALEARKLVLAKGNSSKLEVFDYVTSKFKLVGLNPKKDLDITDAILLGLAMEVLINA